MTAELHKMPSPSPASPAPADGGGGNGHNLHGRVSAIEAHLQYLATKEDIGDVKRLISDRESSMLKWLIGILIANGIALVVALIRLVD